MFQTMQQRKNQTGSAAEINMAPLIDMVFILLIFFLVTTSFVQETGVQVQRPQASSSQVVSAQSMRVSITAAGSVYTHGERVEMDQLKQHLHAFVASEPEGSVIVIPDVQAPAGKLVEVMDLAKLSGVRDVAVAALKDQGQ